MNKAELYHHGIKGQRWGIRRYQNDDGTLTNAGKKRRDQLERQASRYDKKAEINEKESQKAKTAYEDIRKNGKNSKYYEEYLNPDDRASVTNAKSSAKLAREYHADRASRQRQIAQDIRSTQFGKSSIEEVAKRKDLISKGATLATAVGGVALTTMLKDKGLISTGGAAAGMLLTGVAAGATRFKTFDNIYVEYSNKHKN